MIKNMNISNLTPIERRDEIHNRNQIILVIYKTEDNRFSFSIQLKIGKIIRSIFPHQLDETWSSIIEAKHAAFNIMLSWTKNSRTAKKSLFDFEVMNVDQLQLFSESDLFQPEPVSSVLY